MVLLSAAAVILLVLVAVTLFSQGSGPAGTAYGATRDTTYGPTGEIPDGTYLDVIDDGADPAIARMDPQLRSAVVEATAAAAEAGVSIGITSAWRSEAYQVQLMEEEIAEVGEDAASKIVADPSTSKHVTGAAVDVGPMAAMDWMSKHGDEFGLCQIFANELWHYELATTPGGECPPMKSDATEA